MTCHRSVRCPLDDSDLAGLALDKTCESRPLTALETLHLTVPTRSIQSSHVASEESADAPIRAAWIIA